MQGNNDGMEMTDDGKPSEISTGEVESYARSADVEEDALDSGNIDPVSIEKEHGQEMSDNEGNGRAPGDAATGEDADVVAPPRKRQSHRPSLEVVAVTIDSFYDKSEFKQVLKVTTTVRIGL